MLFKDIKFEVLYRLSRTLADIVTDEQWARWSYWYLQRKCGAKPSTLNLCQPETFNEKINWLKVFHRFENGHLLVDKFAVRTLISTLVGSQYLVPLLGVYDSADEIDLSSLPSRFVLKATHGSAWNVIVEDKSRANLKSIRRSLRKWLQYNYFYVGREWQYRKCLPRIICEQYLGGNTERPLFDYKFFCFHGEPLFIQVDVDRFTNHARSFYSYDWVKQAFSILFPEFSRDIPQPPRLKEMLEVARRLSQGLVFARIDLYNQNDKVYFGEITLHPGGGCEPFFPQQFDKILGDYLDVSTLVQRCRV